MTSRAVPPSFKFRVADVDCEVHPEAIRALGLKAADELNERHRRFLLAIAAEKLEWARRIPETLIIGERDVAVHMYG